MYKPTEDYPFDWDVKTAPIYDSGGKVISNYHEIFRDDTNETLHVASKRYFPITNISFMNTVDRLEQEYGCVVTKAGSFKNGAEVFVQMENNDFVEDIIPGDKQGDVKGYVTLANSHNGGLAFKLFAGMIRIWCSNTWTAANRDKNARTALSVKHTMSGEDRVKAFADNIREIANIQRLNTYAIKEKALVQSYKSPHEFGTKLWRLEEKPRPITKTDSNGIKQTTWTPPMYSTRGINLVEKLEDSYEKYTEIEHGNWRMFNAVTDLVDHGSSETRKANGYAMFGSGNMLKLVHIICYLP